MGTLLNFPLLAWIMGFDFESVPLLSDSNRTATNTEHNAPLLSERDKDSNKNPKPEQCCNQGDGDKSIKEDEKKKKWTEWILVINLLAIVFLTFCIDVCLIAYFTDLSLDRGLGEAQVGIIYSSYDISRFIGASVLSYKVWSNANIHHFA